MIIRRATQADIYAVARIHRDAIEAASAYTAEQRASWGANIVPEAYLPYIATSDFFVAVDHDRVIGFGSLDRRAAEVASLYVAPEHMRRGAGRQLIAAIEAAAREAEIARLHVTASINATPFYQAVGFLIVEHSTSRTRGGIEMPCTRMAKLLGELSASGLRPLQR